MESCTESAFNAHHFACIVEKGRGYQAMTLEEENC